MSEVPPPASPDVRVRVVGVGSVGGRLASQIFHMGLPNVDVAAVDTDHTALARLGMPWVVPIGLEQTGGQGTGKRPDLAVEAAEKAGPEIENLVAGGHIAFLISSFGGGTGMGAAPVIAGRLHRAGAVSIVVAIEPFGFEGEERCQAARKAAAFASGVADSVVLVPANVPSDDLQEQSFAQAVRIVNEQVTAAVSSLASMLVQPGAFQLDMGDIGRVLARSGYAALGFGRATGAGSAAEAVRSACSSSLLDAQQLTGSQSVLLHLSVSETVRTEDVERATGLLSRLSVSGDLVLGVTTRPVPEDGSPDDFAEATVICSGFSAEDLPGLAPVGEHAETDPVHDPDAFYYDGQNIDVPTFLRRSRLNRPMTAQV